MVRILHNSQGKKEYAIGEEDLDFFGEVMSRLMRPQLTAPPVQAFQQMPEPVFLPEPTPQRLLMPSPEVLPLPEPHPGVMPQPLTVAYQTRIGPTSVKVKGLSPVQIAITLAQKHKRPIVIATLSFIGGVFILFAGSFLVRQVKPEAAKEEAHVEAVKGEAGKESEGEPPPAEQPPPEPKTVNFPSFPVIPR